MHTRIPATPLALSLACAAAFAAPAADAVALNPRGEGQVLLFPYYTVNAEQQTVVTVVNTTDRVKAVRVTTREGINGARVSGFNLYLAPYDTWTGAISGGLFGPPRWVVGDNSCTAPAAIGAPFSNAAYTGANRDHPTSLGGGSYDSLERTREGFIEMIELGELRAGGAATQLADEATPGANGVPANCAALDAAWQPAAGGTAGAWTTNPGGHIDVPTGGLYGHGAVIDVAGGTMVAYEASALTGFYTNAAAPGALHAAPDTDVTLAANDNGGGTTVATVAVDGATGTTPRTATYPRGTITPVSLVLMQSTVRNEFVVDPALGAATEWIVTMPTKRFHVNPAGNAPASAPFTQRFPDRAYSCDRAALVATNRDGLRTGNGEVCPAGETCMSRRIETCTAVNLLAIGVTTGDEPDTEDFFSPIFGSYMQERAIGREVPLLFNTEDRRMDAGTVSLHLDDPTTTAVDNQMPLAGGAPVVGLPVIGFAAERVVNGNAQPGLLANYAGAYRHHGTLRRAGD